MSTLNDLRLKSRLYYYAAYVSDVYDGDTFTVDIDLGLGLWRRDQKIRLWKVNTPEVSGEEREEGAQEGGGKAEGCLSHTDDRSRSAGAARNIKGTTDYPALAVPATQAAARP